MNFKNALGIATTVLTIGGVVGTGYLTAKATVKAVRKADEMKDAPKKEIAKAVWKYYIPPAAAAFGTASCIVGAHIWNKREQTALAAGQIAIAQSFGQYRKKLTEMYGEDVGRTVEEAILVEKAKKIDICGGGIYGGCYLDVPNEETPMIFEDELSGRRFESTLSKVIEAEYHLNRNFVLEGAASYGEYLNFLGLAYSEEDTDIGWSIDDEFYWIDFDHKIFQDENNTMICKIRPMFSAEKFDY